MRLRLQRSSGKSFFGCLAYPRCKGTVSVPDARQAPLPGMDREQLELREALHQARRDRDRLQLQVDDHDQALRRLRLDLVRLQSQVTLCQMQHTGRPDKAVVSRIEQEIKRFLTVCHPDKWQDHPCATEISKQLNSLRDKLKEGRL